jgi:RNA 3'-terminal phosphate cyclase (ATP)
LIVIDGSYGEGGGQILRTSLSLSAILGQSIRIENIRAGRKKPGLQPQHLTAARAVARICSGRLIGGEVGSVTLELHPKAVEPGDYVFDVSEVKASAGSVNLIFQTVLLPLALARKPSRLTIKGGTHVPWSPPANFIDEIYLPAISRMGVRTFYRMIKAGYYPIGGGEVQVEILPTDVLCPIRLDERPTGNVTCFSAVSNLPESIAERQMTEAVSCLGSIGVKTVEVIDEYESPGKGTLVFILFRGDDIRAGSTALGERGKPAEKVAREACNEFIDWWKSGQAVDKHLADQLVVPMSLAAGESGFTTVEITQHLVTNIHTVRQFLPVEVDLIGEEGQPGAVRIIGAGTK